MQALDTRRLHRLTLRTLVAVSALVLALAVAACGDDDDGGGGAPAASGAASGEGRENVSVALEVLATGVKFTQDFIGGAEQAAKDFGPVELDINGPNGVDPIGAQKQVADMLAKRPDAMGIAPFPPEVWQRTFKTVTEQVDHTLAFSIRPADKSEGAVIKTLVSHAPTEIARLVMHNLIEASKLGKDTTGTALLGQCAPGESGVLFERTTGFKQALAEDLPQVQVKVFDSKPDPQANSNAWEAILKANPDPVLAIGTCDQDGTSLYKAKRRTGGNFPVGALETPPETIRGVKDGTIAAAAAVNWWLEGYTSVRLLAGAARGEETIPEGWINTGYTVIDQDNIEEIELRDSSAAEAAKWYAPKVDELFSNLEANVKPFEDHLK